MRVTNNKGISPNTAKENPIIHVNLNFSPGEILPANPSGIPNYSRDPVGIHAASQIPVGKFGPNRTVKA